MFWKKRKLTKAADEIGELLHSQLTSILEIKIELYHKPEEMAFTTAYLNSFVDVAFSELDCNDEDLKTKYIRHICNGVYPKRLWDIFQRGFQLNYISQGGNRKEYDKVLEAYKIGENAGKYDANQFYNNGIKPSNFSNYYLNKAVIF